MASRILSIFLGSGTAKLAEVEYSGKKVHVYSVYDVTLSDGLVEDGIIFNPDDLAQELKQYINDFKIKTKKIGFSVASKRIAGKEIVIPFVKEKQIPDLLQANAADYFPIANLHEYTLSYSILEVIQNEVNKQYRLSVIAVPNDLLANYVEVAKKLKMSIEVMDYAGNAILQVLKLQANAGDVSAILQLGREGTVINVMNGKTLIMQRSISYGLDAIIGAVKDAVHMDDEDAQAFIEDNEIEKICGAYPEVDEVVSLITNGCGRIFDFYMQRNGQNPITSVMFLGDGTLINGIGNAMEKNFGLPTMEILSLKHVVVKNKTMNNNDPTNFLANVGSVIAPMNLKYLTEEEAVKDRKEEKLPWRLVVLSIVGAAVLAGATISMYYMAKEERDNLQRQLASLEEVRGLEGQMIEAESKAQAVRDFLNSTKGPNDSLYRLITDMEKVMPEGMSIDSFVLTDGTISLSAGGVGKASVAKFIMEMKALNYVQNVKIDYISEVIDGIDNYDSFNMTFTLLDINAIEDLEESNTDEITMDDMADENIDAQIMEALEESSEESTEENFDESVDEASDEFTDEDAEESVDDSLPVVENNIESEEQ